MTKTINITNKRGKLVNGEGWFQLHNAVKRHYFVDGQSLCKRWMRFGDSGLDWGGDDNPNNCKACMRKLGKHRKE